MVHEAKRRGEVTMGAMCPKSKETHTSYVIIYPLTELLVQPHHVPVNQEPKNNTTASRRTYLSLTTMWRQAVLPQNLSRTLYNFTRPAPGKLPACRESNIIRISCIHKAVFCRQGGELLIAAIHDHVREWAASWPPLR